MGAALTVHIGATDEVRIVPEIHGAVKQRIRFCASRDEVRIAFATAGEGPPLMREAAGQNRLPLSDPSYKKAV